MARFQPFGQQLHPSNVCHQLRSGFCHLSHCPPSPGLKYTGRARMQNAACLQEGLSMGLLPPTLALDARSRSRFEKRSALPTVRMRTRWIAICRKLNEKSAGAVATTALTLPFAPTVAKKICRRTSVVQDELGGYLVGQLTSHLGPGHTARTAPTPTCRHIATKWQNAATGPKQDAARKRVKGTGLVIM